MKLTPIKSLPISELPVSRRRRFQGLDETDDQATISLVNTFSEHPKHISSLLNWKAIDVCSTAVRKHRVYGKPLKIPKIRKKRAAKADLNKPGAFCAGFSQKSWFWVPYFVP